MEPSRNEVWGTIVQIVRELDEERIATRPLEPDSRLAHDLGLSSVDSIHLMISLEDAFKQPLELESLVIRNGQYADDLALGALCDHICEKLHVAQ